MSASSYLEWPAAPDLRRDVACTWIGHIGTADRPYTERVLPDGCIDIIFDGARLFVAGPDTTAVPVTARPGTTFTGIRFRPGHAAAVLGAPAAAVRDQRPDLAEVWGAAAADAVTAGLATAATPARALVVLEHAVRRRVRRVEPSDTLIDGVVEALGSGGRRGPGTVARLADDLGVTERTLHRRCTAAVGYGPKTLDRVLRLRRALAFAGAGCHGLGAIAAASGYADQAHFTREVGRLAGETPSELFKTATAAPA